MIYYFSGTGNSLYAANIVGEALGEKILNIADYGNNKLNHINIDKDEIIGFVFPVYYYSIPTLVEEFLNNIEIDKNEDTKVFVLVTCGATTGDSTKKAQDILKEKGLETDFTFAVEMPDNYVLMYDVQDKVKQEKTLKNSEESLKKIIELIQSDKKGNYNKIKGPMSGIMTFLAGALYRNGRKTSKFYAIDDCTSCNLCQEICPVDAIKMENGKPIWIKNQCVHCLACIHRCPVQAIQYGKKTKKRGRYVNPLSG